MADTLQPKGLPGARNLRDRLSSWDAKVDAKAPLTERQKDGFIELTTLSVNRPLPIELPPDDTAGLPSYSQCSSSAGILDEKTILTNVDKVETAQQFFAWFSDVESQVEQEEEFLQRDFLTRLQQYQLECDHMVEEVEQCLEFLTVLKTDYVRVATKTNALHEACENLLEDQTRLVHVAENINSRLGYFNELDRITSKLNSPSFSVNSESFLPLLTQLDDCIEYLNKHPKYRETPVYLAKFKQCLSRSLGLLKVMVFGILQAATHQVYPQKDVVTPIDDAFTLFYGKFRTNAPRIKLLMDQVEQRLDKSSEYHSLLADCHHCYFQQRLTLLMPSITSAISELASRHSRDHCALVRSGCAFMIHICEDEHQLFYHFFSRSTPLLDQTLENLCMNLYDALRPLIIHINHLETLAELCSILKIEMMEEHIRQNAVQLAAFDMVCGQMLQDVQERLVYRTHVYIRQEVLNYNPGSGDLAYPSKLEMMESIAEKIRVEHEQQKALSRKDSTSSIQSLTSAEVEEITHTARMANQRIEELARDTTSIAPSTLNGSSAPKTALNIPLDVTGSNMPMSPADLHGMWYPTVRRTLVCMSKLYRCIDKTTFQGLSQETLSMCIQSLVKASDIISKNQSVLDGQLFLIKHLLILREQIAPFHIDFAVKEMALDFSKLRNAAVELLKARSKLFSFNSNNAVLQFLLDGTPAVMETYIDSKKEVDTQLKRTCEDFIQNVSAQFVGHLASFITKAKVVVQMSSANENGSSDGIRVVLRQQPFAVAEKVRDVITETYRQLKQRKVDVQRKMTLYLANKDTEYILFKPMKANVIQCFQQLYLLLQEQYTEEDRLIIAAPSVEQINLLLANTLTRPTAQ